MESVDIRRMYSDAELFFEILPGNGFVEIPWWYALVFKFSSDIWTDVSKCWTKI